MIPYWADDWTTLYLGDAREVLRSLPAESVHCIVTSPPYWRLRDYNLEPSTWGDAWRGTLGLEPTPEMYVQHIVECFREVRRVLREDGTLWLNMGDGYAANRGYQVRDNKHVDVGNEMGMSVALGLKPKDLLGMPWRVAFALQADGWWLRSDCIWSKPNPMPESVQGSHFTRHRVTMEEYENLSRLRVEQRRDQDGASDLSDVSARAVSDSQAPLSAERERSSDSPIPRGTGGRKGEATAGIGSGPDTAPKADTNRERAVGKPPLGERAIRSVREGQGQEASGLRQEASGYRGVPSSDSGRLDGDSSPAQEPLPLLRQAEAADTRPCDSLEQGRPAREGEHSSSLPELQLGEERQADPALVDCPGCAKCSDGFIFHLSAGRPTRSHEYVFLLTKAARYYYDADAIREKGSDNSHGGGLVDPSRKHHLGKGIARHSGLDLAQSAGEFGRNKRSVWEIATQPFPGAHFATFPEDLVRPCIQAGTSERGCCLECGAAWDRVVETDDPKGRLGKGYHDHMNNLGRGQRGVFPAEGAPTKRTTGWQVGCQHKAEPIPCVVLDIFGGSGTVGVVARKAGRRSILIDLKAEYLEMARERCAQGVLL